MACTQSLQNNGIQGLLIGACAGAVYALYKKFSDNPPDSEFKRILKTHVRDFGLTGLVVGLIYGAWLSCIDH